MFKNILVPTDGSEPSERAIHSAVQLAKSLNAAVTGLYVITGLAHGLLAKCGMIA
jgi:nucleotide-binding universal stress UspA family protein